jgi:hypothetical protein
MRRGWLLVGAGLALVSSLALAAPESLLPPSFQNPAPAPSPSPRPAPAPTPASPAAQGAAPAGPSVSTPVIQPLPGMLPGEPLPKITLPPNFPSLQELEAMSPDAFDELFGLKPKFDIPAGARRAVRQVGIIDETEGGFAAGLLDAQPAELVRAALTATKGPLVSRWGHILLRRALASRMDAPRDMDPVDFAAMRAALLNRIGESAAARALVQDVDSANYNTGLADAAFDAYLATGDVLGICPVAQLKSTLRDDPEWNMARAICGAYAGNERQADRDLEQMRYYGRAPRIDALLAERYAGAAGQGRRAVNIEWNNVNELTPWRFALTRSLGMELPGNLSSEAARFSVADVLNPAVPLAERAAAADRIAGRGILSSAALVDLYSQLWAEGTIEGRERERAGTLRQAYVERSPAARVDAMRTLWGNGDDYGRQVLTAYAAARLPASDTLVDDAPLLIASMLSAGLDRNAMAWGAVVPEGSLGWAMLTLAQPQRSTQVSRGAVSSFVDDDSSTAQRKSRFLVAGLAGLGRLDMGAANDFAGKLGVDFGRESPWSRKINLAAELNNPALVALLAGLGMQGESWDKMTARHLFHIVRALNRVGLDAEARMIAAEAVARG